LSNPGNRFASINKKQYDNLYEIVPSRTGTRKHWYTQNVSPIPADKMDYKPHEKSMNLKALATHIAELPTWITMAIKTDELDFKATPYSPKNCNNADELLAYYDASATEATRLLNESNDTILEDTWTLRDGDAIYMQLTKLETIRHSFCQLVHHRAQLGVYLRLLNIPIPGVYGPSADEQQMGA